MKLHDIVEIRGKRWVVDEEGDLRDSRGNTLYTETGKVIRNLLPIGARVKGIHGIGRILRLDLSDYEYPYKVEFEDGALWKKWDVEPFKPRWR